MDSKHLKNKLIGSLGKIYYMEAFNQLTEFLQGELYVLYFLAQNQDMEINPSILSDNLHISRPRITATLSTLRKKKYVETINSDYDRRKILVIITSEGLNFIERKKENVDKYFELFIEGLGEENSKELIRLIDLAVDIVNQDESNNSF